MAKYLELTALKGLLREKKITYQKTAEILGMTTRTFSNKINGHNAFDVIELDKIAQYFNIDTTDVGKYFFP